MLSLVEHHQIEINGLSLHVVQAGPKDGPVAILLHGFPEFWLAWANQIDSLVAAGFRVWIPDQRGYNTSEKPKNLNAYRMDVLVDDICRLIDATGKKHVVLCGHDWGGAIAWRLVNKYPEKISRLIIVNSPHNAAISQRLKSSFTQLLKSWYMFFFQLPWLPEYALRRNNFKALVKALCARSRQGSFTELEIENYRRAWSQSGALTAMLNWYRARFQHQLELDGNQNIHVPTLLIWGAKDHAFDRDLASSSIELCEKGESKFIEEAGHWVCGGQVFSDTAIGKMAAIFRS